MRRGGRGWDGILQAYYHQTVWEGWWETRGEGGDCDACATHSLPRNGKDVVVKGDLQGRMAGEAGYFCPCTQPILPAPAAIGMRLHHAWIPVFTARRWAFDP